MNASPRSMYVPVDRKRRAGVSSHMHAEISDVFRSKNLAQKLAITAPVRGRNDQCMRLAKISDLKRRAIWKSISMFCGNAEKMLCGTAKILPLMMYCAGKLR